MNFMIFASGVSIAINLLLVILVAVCLLLCLVVLMQRPKQEGLGAAFGGGMTDQAFGARTTDVLQKGTVYLGTAFFVITLGLSVLVSMKNAEANEAAEITATTEDVLGNEDTVTDVAAALEEVEPAVETATDETPAEVPAETPATEPTEAQ